MPIFTNKMKWSGCVLGYGVICSVMLMPGAVFAAGSAGHGDVSISTLEYPLYNFILYVLLMVFMYRTFVRPVLRNYRAEVESYAVRVQNEHVTLERELDQLKYKLENIGEEKEIVIAELEKSGREMADDIISQANQKAERIQQDFIKRAESERQKIFLEAKKELVGKVIESVRDRLLQSYSEADDKSLIQNALNVPSDIRS
jgi:F0F1-type ATP synthase membrane subunit b/b'